MCFRPTEVTMKKCSACGKVNKPVAQVCEACGAALDGPGKDFDADQSRLDAAVKPPTVPGAAPAPSAPSAPKAPQNK